MREVKIVICSRMSCRERPMSDGGSVEELIEATGDLTGGGEGNAVAA
jgi:hypothetical protein